MQKNSTSAERASRYYINQLDALLRNRFLDLCVQWRRKKTKELIFEVGGRWDRAGACFDGKSDRCKIHWITEAQVEAADAFGTWIDARRRNAKRLNEICLDGGWGSGKTHVATLAAWCIAIEFPESRCWMVPPVTTQRWEIDNIVKDWIPSSWRLWEKAALSYTLPNRSSLVYIGAERDEKLSQGGAEVVFLNEMQAMTDRAYAHGAKSIRNVSGRPKGLLIVAMNPAVKERGQWTEDHLEKLDSHSLNGRRIIMDPALNSIVEEGTADEIDAMVASVRPDLAAAGRGVHRRLGELAAPAFKPVPVAVGGHIGKPPEIGWFDATRQISSRLTGREQGYPDLVGCDFQMRPHCAGQPVRVYRREDNKQVYYAYSTILSDGNEDDLAEKVIEAGFDPADALAVADASGAWQNTQRKRTGIYSHDILREHGFSVVAPATVKSKKSRFFKNPDLDNSLAVLFDVCTEGRLLVDPDCEWLIEALRRCKVKRMSGRNRLNDEGKGYAHVLDCLRYVIWYCEPRRRPMKPQFDAATFDRLSGVRILSNG